MNVTLKQGRDIIENNGGLVIVNKVLESLNLNAKNRFCDDQLRSDAIPFGSIISSVISNQCMGYSHYSDIERLNQSSIFVSGLGRTISEESFRQKLNYLGNQDDILNKIDELNVELLKTCNFIEETYNKKQYIPLDLDVTVLDNEKVHKEGISYTYKGVNGYSPINSYLGHNALCFELREGKQHSEKNAPKFLEHCIDMSDKIGVNRSAILVRVDSAHDAADFINTCLGKGVKFIVKENPRKEKHIDILELAVNNKVPDTNEYGVERYYVIVQEPPRTGVCKNSIYQVFKVTATPCEQGKLTNYSKNLDPFKDYEIESYYTNMDLAEVSSGIFNEKEIAKSCVEAYHNHATSEQFHSELKTDMHVRLLPSKYFSTNSLVLRISAIAFNILRNISYLALEFNSSKLNHRRGRNISRMRISSVIDNFIKIPCKVVSHARNLLLQFSRSYSLYTTFNYIFKTI